MRREDHPTMRRSPLLLLVLALLVPPGTAEAAKTTARLKRFDDCGQLVRYAKRHMQGYDTGGPPPPFTPVPVTAPVNAGAEGPTAAPQDSSGDDFSLTNNQEAGVFEPDIVKTDGRLVYALSGGVLHIVTVRGTPAEVSSLALDGSAFDDQMLLFQDRLLISGTDNQGGT